MMLIAHRGRNPVKLLFVIKSLSCAGGGAERVLALVASELASRGHEVAIASFDPVGSEDFYAIDGRVARHRFGPGRLRGIGALRSLLRASRPDAAVGFMHSAFMPLALAAAGTRIRLVASEHTVYAHYKTRPGLPILLRACAPFFDAGTVPTEKARDGYPAGVRGKMTVIPNPVAAPSAPRSRPPAADQLTVVAVGNLRREKGHATLIEAFARLAPDHPKWELRIAGEGPERMPLERLVDGLRLGSQMKFLGPVRDVAKVYAQADIFAMPSAYESFGLATAEALVAGVPAIGFADCPGTNQLIQHGKNGLLVSGTDRVEALARGLRELMDSADLRSRLAAAAPESIEIHSVKAVTDLWEDMLSGFGDRPSRTT